MTFLIFFHSLLSEGIIPEKEEFHVSVWYGYGYGSGKHIYITDAWFTDPIFDYLDDSETSSVKLSSLHYEFEMKYVNGEWNLVKEWRRPISPPPAHTNT